MVEREESPRTYRKAPINPAYGVKVTKADDDHVVQLPEDECTVGGFQKPKRVCQFFSLLSFGEMGAGKVELETDLLPYATYENFHPFRVTFAIEEIDISLCGRYTVEPVDDGSNPKARLKMK